MHRLVWAVCFVVWISSVGVVPLAAQRIPGTSSLPTLDEPRPRPIFPALLIPFSIPESYCRSGRLPRVTLRAFSGLTQPIATLVLRNRPAAELDAAPLRCGAWVARWDGVIQGPPARIAPNAVYYLQLAVDTSSSESSPRPPILRTRKLVVAN